jgi:23S rRNA (pseudouridine1915-N3)-methyltransferase
MRLLAIGKAKSGPEGDLFSRYAARIRPNLLLLTFDDGHGTPIEIKRREAVSLLAALEKSDFAVALDTAGMALDSPGLAKHLTKWTETGRRLNFIIGGAEGLDEAVIERADAKLSLGALTWPHMLVRPMLAEQLYRAQMITAGHPYHRAGRPS